MFPQITVMDVAGLIVNAGLLIVAVVALQFAKAQSRASRDANELTRAAQRSAAEKEAAAAEQMLDDSRRTTRPYVWAEVRTSLAGNGSYDLTLRNTGRSPARGLIVTTEWPNPGDEFTDDLRTVLTTPRDLPPGGSLRLMWRITGSPTSGESEMGMPEKCSITVSYGGDDRGYGTFKEDWNLDAHAVARGPSPQEGAISQSGSGVELALKNVDNAVRAINVHLGELRR